MESRKITPKEQSCISDCIRRHWSDPHDDRELEKVDAEYQRCLSQCQVCG